MNCPQSFVVGVCVNCNCVLGGWFWSVVPVLGVVSTMGVLGAISVAQPERSRRSAAPMMFLFMCLLRMRFALEKK